MQNCWAFSNGDCSGKLTGEHIISKGIFKENNIYVKGFDWCINDYQAIGLNSLTKKVLCNKHNSTLSPVDVGGINAINSLERVFSLCNELDLNNSKIINLQIPNIDGHLFERWLLKVAINLIAGSDIILGDMGEESGKPPPYLIDVVFGKLDFSHFMGLYFLISENSHLSANTEIAITPLIKENRIGGYYFSIFGFDFVLSLFPGPPPTSLREIGITGLPDHVLDSYWIYRCPKIMAQKGLSKSHEVVIDWKIS